MYSHAATVYYYQYIRAGQKWFYFPAIIKAKTFLFKVKSATFEVFCGIKFPPLVWINTRTNNIFDINIQTLIIAVVAE